jgi:sugar O-acyltransferase (sialic acid O-acetyltransferase NeuD family)
MLKHIFLPRLDANTVEVVIREWYCREGEQVSKGEKLLAIETDKAVIDVESEHSGVLLKTLAAENSRIPIPFTVAIMGDAVAELDSPEFQKELQVLANQGAAEPVEAAHVPEAKPVAAGVTAPRAAQRETIGRLPEAAPATNGPVIASPAARRLAREMGIDLAKISGSGGRGEITARDIMALTGTLSAGAPAVKVAEARKKVLVIGAGDGGYIISDILGFEPQKWEIVGFLDDKQSLWGQELRTCQVLGGTEQIMTLKQQGFFDCVVISITSNMAVRKKIFEKHRALGLEFINVIHPTVHINPSAKIGVSNLIYGMVYIGTETRIGDNNLISAHSSIDHHNNVGSHNLFGPGVLTSGAVTIGDSCIFGAGVGMEPHLKIGNNVKIASGLAVTSHVPDGMVMKGRFAVGA